MDQEKGNGWLQALHPDDLVRWTKSYAAAFSARRPFEIEYRLRRADDAYRCFVAVGRPFSDLDGRFAGYIGSSYDMTERKQQEEQLAYLAAHDPLTGLPNRRSLEEAMERAVSRARRGYPSALLFLDVDNFKVINDTLGHAAGDRALVSLTEFLQKHLRGEDMMARLGGDEFAVLIEGTTVKEAHVIAERMRRAMKDFQLSLEGVNYNLGLSIGLVPIDGSQAPAAVLSQADAAMYKAKELGRNRVVV
jgi:diguanylate cyclase (GGDEF)-like protein